MIETYRNYDKYIQLEKFPHEYFGSNNTTLLTAEEFIQMLKLDGWFTDILTKESIHQLEKLSKDELLDFVKVSYGIK
jgi:hypothetical protein